jgi:hypothetical protein
MLKQTHRMLSTAGKNIADFTLLLFGLILLLCPFAALCGSIYLGAILMDYMGLGLWEGLSLLAIWFIFVCVYVADHVRPHVVEAATKLGRSN